MCCTKNVASNPRNSILAASIKKRARRKEKRNKKDEKTQKQLEKFSAVTKQNLESIGDGRLSLKQKSLNVELTGLFNQGKRSNLVKKLGQKQRMNKARCQGNLADLLQGPKIQTVAENTTNSVISNSEANKENIPPNSQFFRQNSAVKLSDVEDNSIAAKILDSIPVPEHHQSTPCRTP